MTGLTRALALCAACLIGPLAGAQQTGPMTIERDDYVEHSRGFWRALLIANWTGLRAEGREIAPPFLTDAAWNQPYHGSFLEFVWWPNPWRADDDNDIEYVYLQLADEADGRPISAEAIRDGWVAYINQFIWVSNARARALMARGVRPPGTGLTVANIDSLMIDAQLTTEIFGLFHPGMPEAALKAADLPIRTTAAGHAAHASQFYVLLHALAPRVMNAPLTPRERVLWLVNESRRYLPPTSKAAEIVDIVLADYLANPNRDDWERTRDLIYARYQRDAAVYGWRYRDWFESSINFAAGVVTLLYGEGDLQRTIRIGTLAGWDCDNQAATLGGLVGFIMGDAQVRGAFAGLPLSENFTIWSTRPAMPDLVPPSTNGFEDTFSMMAERTASVAQRALAHHGGAVDASSGTWLIPGLPAGDVSLRNPRTREDARSITLAQRRAGLVPSATRLPNSGFPSRGGSFLADFIVNGLESDFSGREEFPAERDYCSTENAPLPPDGQVAFTVTYPQAALISHVRFVEGDHFTTFPAGGGFASASIQLLVGGTWLSATGSWDQPFDPSAPFQVMTFALDAPQVAAGVRVIGPPSGAPFVTCAELDALGPEPSLPGATFDADGDGRLTIDDLYAFEASPRDVSGDGVIDESDRAWMVRAVRFSEVPGLLAR